MNYKLKANFCKLNSGNYLMSVYIHYTINAFFVRPNSSIIREVSPSEYYYLYNKLEDVEIEELPEELQELSCHEELSKIVTVPSSELSIISQFNYCAIEEMGYRHIFHTNGCWGEDSDEHIYYYDSYNNRDARCGFNFDKKKVEERNKHIARQLEAQCDGLLHFYSSYEGIKATTEFDVKFEKDRLPNIDVNTMDIDNPINGVCTSISFSPVEYEGKIYNMVMRADGEFDSFDRVNKLLISVNERNHWQGDVYTSPLTISLFEV